MFDLDTNPLLQAGWYVLYVSLTAIGIGINVLVFCFSFSFLFLHFFFCFFRLLRKFV